MSIVYRVKRGDTWPNLSAQLMHQGGAIDLTGATVQLVARSASKIIQRSATVTDALSGFVTCALSAEDTEVSGRYNAEFEITFYDGRKTTVPNNDHFRILIIDDL